MPDAGERGAAGSDRCHACYARLAGWPLMSPGHCMQVLLYESFTKLSTATADTAAGGFSLVMVNTTKLCDAAADGCAESRSHDECVRHALDAARTTTPTPGQRAVAEAAAAAAAASRRAATTTAAAVGPSVGAVLLALMLVLLLVVRPRLRKRRAAAAQLKAAGGGAAASGQGASSHDAGSASGSALGQWGSSFGAAAAASADAAFATDLQAAFGAPAAAVQCSGGARSVHSGSAPKPVVMR